MAIKVIKHMQKISLMAADLVHTCTVCPLSFTSKTQQICKGRNQKNYYKQD